MKVTFIFTDTPDLQVLSHEDQYKSHFEFPDAALKMADCKERIVTIAELVGQLSHAVVHFTCKELDLKSYPVKLTKDDGMGFVRHSFRNMLIRFESFRRRSKTIKVLLPVHTGINNCAWHMGFVSPGYTGGTDEQKQQIAIINILAEQCLALLNSEPFPEGTQPPWRYAGFDPFRTDGAAIKRFNKRSRKAQAEAKRREREEQKRKEREAKRLQQQAENQTSPPATGAGRRVGAVPGIFKGVQFRSQLKIRFVTQLEAKQIR
jgi:hypothetical protein